MERWQGRLEEENRVRIRKGVVAVPATDVLSFSNLYELIDLLRPSDRWEVVSTALGPQSEILPLLKALDRYRNDIAHSRPLRPHQVFLVAGVSGLIRNMVTLYMSSADAAGDIYPRMEWARDSLGNELQLNEMSAGAAQLYALPRTVVRPGDEITFEIMSTDPQDRAIEYSVRMPRQSMQGIGVVESGDAIAFTWAVTEQDVQELCSITFRMTAVGTTYHRGGSYDHSLMISYTVRPPLR